MTYSDTCLAAVVTRNAIDALLEGGGRGAFKDSQPWVVANEILAAAGADGQSVALLLAAEDADSPLALSHWAEVTDIDVLEFHKGSWQTTVSFGPLKAVNPIWNQLDSVILKPPAEVVRREQLEPIRIYRQHLDEQHIRPYAICETPAFIHAPASGQPASADGQTG